MRRYPLDYHPAKKARPAHAGVFNAAARRVSCEDVGTSYSHFHVSVYRLRKLFEPHSISGRLKGYNVRKDAEESLQFYAANNVFTGPFRQAPDALARDLSLTRVWSLFSEIMPFPALFIGCQGKP
jgi:hypothetical protein